MVVRWQEFQGADNMRRSDLRALCEFGCNSAGRVLVDPYSLLLLTAPQDNSQDEGRNLVESKNLKDARDAPGGEAPDEHQVDCVMNPPGKEVDVLWVMQQAEGNV